MAIILFLLLMVAWPATSTREVICSLDKYIVNGLEFSTCQKETMVSFNDGSGTIHHCSQLKHVVDNCGPIVEVCVPF